MAGLIILAGGKSSRMGRNKALLSFGTKTGIERIVDELKPLSVNPILVTNEPHLFQHLEVKIVQDNYPGMGPLAGLEAGLSVTEEEWNILVACDMPFVSQSLAEELWKRTGEWDCVVPMLEGRAHPLFALYNKSILPVVRGKLEGNTLKMMAVLESCNTLYVREEDLKKVDNLEDALFNMNVPTDYETAAAKVKEGK